MQHHTLHEDVLGFIDQQDQEIITGWCFHKTLGTLPLRIKIEDNVMDIERVDRQDVSIFYGNSSIVKCGWSMKKPICLEFTIEMKIHLNWEPILNGKSKSTFKVELNEATSLLPTFVVVDNFYKNPDQIREFALAQTFQENLNYHKGKRSINEAFRFPELKLRFEKILNRKIDDWNRHGVNGCFQYCIAGEQAVYHHDMQQFAGIIYLTPDAPPNAGTCFYRSKNTKNMKMGNDDYESVFKTGHYDSTQFDLVDVVGNVYNRLVLFDAQLIHAAPTYFGNSLKNGRLFQLFFFDLE